MTAHHPFKTLCLSALLTAPMIACDSDETIDSPAAGTESPVAGTESPVAGMMSMDRAITREALTSAMVANLELTEGLYALDCEYCYEFTDPTEIAECAEIDFDFSLAVAECIYTSALTDAQLQESIDYFTCQNEQINTTPSCQASGVTSCGDLESCYAVLGSEECTSLLSAETTSVADACNLEVECADGSCFTCEDGLEISGGWVCDGFPDCSGEEDEADCEPFICASGDEQINADWQCDGEADCTDGSDEVGCEG